MNATPEIPERQQVPPQEPFWDWTDAGLFAGLGLPTLAVAMAASFGLRMVMPAAFAAMAFQLIWYALWLTALWQMLRMKYEEPFWKGLGWKTRWPRMAWTPFMGPALAMVVVVTGVLINTPEIDNPIQQLMTDRWSTLAVGGFATTLGPVAEELAFRGFLLPLLVRSLGAVGGVTVCSVLFAVLHGPQYSWTWQHMTLLFLASVVFSVTRLRTGSTAAASMVHATYNMTFFTGYLLQGRDWLI